MLRSYIIFVEYPSVKPKRGKTITFLRSLMDKEFDVIQIHNENENRITNIIFVIKILIKTEGIQFANSF